MEREPSETFFDDGEHIEGLRRVRQYNIDNVDVDDVCTTFGDSLHENEREGEEEDLYHVEAPEDVEESEIETYGAFSQTQVDDINFSWGNDSEFVDLQPSRPIPDSSEVELINQNFEEEEFDETSLKLDGTTLYIGQCFESVYNAREYLRMHAVKSHFKLWLKKNESTHLDARCKNKATQLCSWRCLVRRTNDGRTFRVRKVLDEHTCMGMSNDVNPSADARWIAIQIEEQMRLHHKSYTPNDIQEEMWKMFCLRVKYWQAWHARAIALEKVNGNYDDSYLKVAELCRQVLLSNPNSVAKWSRNEQFYTFNSICISFSASINGFIAGCRPLVGLDGCFLKGKYGGALLSMIALDGNNGILPLAFFICRGENQENWTKFLNIMHPHLSKHPMNLTFISDRQKGLVQAVPRVFPESSQRYCFRHMYQNFKTKYRGLGDLAWGASRCYKESRFKHIMADMEKHNKLAAAYLMGEDPTLWARSHFDHMTCSAHNTNNFSEAFNAWISDTRDKPIVKIVMRIQSLIRNLIFERNEIASGLNDDDLLPRVKIDIKKKVKKVREFTLGGASLSIWQVTDSYGSWWVVDLEKKTCSCMEWQISGIPCQHAVCVIHERRSDYADYCSPFFKGAAFKATYCGTITPIKPEEDWDEPAHHVLPPLRQRQPGRPRVNRRKAQGEDDDVGSTGRNKCTLCGVFGHNSRTCQYGEKGGNNRNGVLTLPPRPHKKSKRGGRPRTLYQPPQIPIEAAPIPIYSLGRGSDHVGVVRGTRRGRGGRRGRVQRDLPVTMDHYNYVGSTSLRQDNYLSHFPMRQDTNFHIPQVSSLQMQQDTNMHSTQVPQQYSHGLQDFLAGFNYNKESCSAPWKSQTEECSSNP